MKHLINWKKFNEELFFRGGWRDCIELGPTPTSEDAVQVEESGAYLEPMKKEVDRYVDMLIRRFPNCTNVHIASKSNSHDFGTYYEAVVYYNDDSIDEALFIEHNLPDVWEDTEVLNYTKEDNTDDDDDIDKDQFLADNEL